MVKDRARWNARWIITKFRDETGEVARYTKGGHSAKEAIVKFSGRFIEVVSFGPNGLTDDGVPALWNQFIGTGSAIPFSNTNSRLGVSTDLTGFDGSQSNLNPSGSATFYMQLMDASFPTVTGNTATWEATYDGNTANFTWNSFGVDNDSGDGSGNNIGSYNGTTIVLLNRFVQDQGTKVIGNTWVLSLLVELS